jgi:hypothetical protein
MAGLGVGKGRRLRRPPLSLPALGLRADAEESPRGGPEAEDGEVFRPRIRLAVDCGP